MMMIIIRILFYFCLITSLPAHAFSLKPWFENTNQRAARLMTEEKYADAEQTFTRPDWQAVAAYRGQNYEKASKYFKQLNNAEGFYNYGNALAQSKQYQAAINAYDKTLKLNPDNQDAIYNRDLVKKLLEENKQDQKQDQDQNKQQQDQDKNQRDQNKSEQDQNKSEQDQDKKDQAKEKQDQNKNKQDQDKSQQDQKQQEQQQQEQDQALRLVPDDPGGLLREKFWRDHWRRARAAQS